LAAYASVRGQAFDPVTDQMSILGSSDRYFPVPEGSASPQPSGSARISAIWHLPEVLREFGVDPGEVLEAAGVRRDIFDDRENRIEYPDFGRLLLASEQLSKCDHIAFLASQRTQLADFGLPAQLALCSQTAGEALRKFAFHFSLHNTAAIVTMISSGDYNRLVYAIVEQGMHDTRPFQLGAITMALNVLRDLCGPAFQPVAVTFASRGPTDLRPVHAFFRAPVRFDSEESAVIFERRWLDRPLPEVDPQMRLHVESAAQAQMDLLLTDLPGTVRRLLRKHLLLGECSMDRIAGQLGMHRRTLDRKLQRRGVLYSDLLESVKKDVAQQLLRDTDMRVQQVAESLNFSSAANFATAFRRWTGVTPSTFRRGAR
jgi:AraC-like DNA-binding protein